MTNQRNTFLQPFPSSQTQLHSQFFYFVSPSCAGVLGIGVVDSSSHIVCTGPSFSYCTLLWHGFPPIGIVFHELLQCGSFPWDAVLHRLLYCGSPTKT